MAAAAAVVVFVFADGFVPISVENIFKYQKISGTVSQNTFNKQCGVAQKQMLESPIRINKTHKLMKKIYKD